jgi:putative colanic acid biosynthesis acetyltransferase WcaF
MRNENNIFTIKNTGNLMSIMNGIMPKPGVNLNAYDQSWYKRGRDSAIVVLWELVQTFLIRPSPHPLYAWRNFWYRLFGAKLGEKVLLRNTVTCNYPWRLAIGNNSWVGDEVTLYCLECIRIGDNVVISQQAYLCTGTHDHRDPRFGLEVRPVIIEAGAWIGLGALIMPGVTIGEGALIGARAVLTHDALPWTIYHGMPARPVGQRILRMEFGMSEGPAASLVL